MKKTVAIFGGGTSSLALASFLDPDLFKITLYEKNRTCGRKFLVAGKGGFNLTYFEPMDRFKNRYIPTSFLEEALNNFTNNDLRNWLSGLGIDTYVGSSNRVFPIKGIKPIQVLDVILNHIESKGVDIKYQMKWDGWSSSGLPLVNEDIEIKADYYAYAFGGASWKITGSTGEWAEHFRVKGVEVNDFEASNCAFKVGWASQFIELAEGKPLKNIAVMCEDKVQKGELVITCFGLEGNAIYVLSNNIRRQLKEKGSAEVSIDFKPMFSKEDLKLKSLKSKSGNNTEFLKKDLNLNKIQIQMIKYLTSKEVFINRDRLIEVVKNMPIEIVGMAPIDEAISTVGGVRREALTEVFELKRVRGSFSIGEMADWDAPTGGYLLQGCFSMGVFLADHLNKLGCAKHKTQN